MTGVQVDVFVAVDGDDAGARGGEQCGEFHGVASRRGESDVMRGEKEEWFGRSD